MKQLIIECVDFEFKSHRVESSGDIDDVLFNEMFYDVVDIAVNGSSFSEADLMLSKKFKEMDIVDSKDFNSKYDVILVLLDTDSLHTSDHMINHLMTKAIKHCEGTFTEFLLRHNIEFKTLECVNGVSYSDIVKGYKDIGV